jgi:hypothetical protein
VAKSLVPPAGRRHTVALPRYLGPIDGGQDGGQDGGDHLHWAKSKPSHLALALGAAARTSCDLEPGVDVEASRLKVCVRLDGGSGRGARRGGSRRLNVVTRMMMTCLEINRSSAWSLAIADVAVELLWSRCSPSKPVLASWASTLGNAISFALPIRGARVICSVEASEPRFCSLHFQTPSNVPLRKPPEPNHNGQRLPQSLTPLESRGPCFFFLLRCSVALPCLVAA